MNEEISIRLEGKAIKSEAFLKAVGNFFKIAKCVSSEFSTTKVDWEVTVKQGSAIVSGHPITSNFAIGQDILGILIAGFSSLSQGRVHRPLGFTDSALQAVRALAASNIEHIQILNGDVKVTLRREIVGTIDTILGAKHVSFGEVEGKLSVLSDHGEFQFLVTEPIRGQDVKCNITDDRLIDLAVQAFRKRVIVEGLIKYRKNGTPISIDANEITVMDTEKYPTVDEVIGIYHKK